MSLVSLKTLLDPNTSLVLFLFSPKAELLQISVRGSDQSPMQEECGVGTVVSPSTAGSLGFRKVLVNCERQELCFPSD